MSGAIKINGTSSGSTTITAPASGGDETIELSTALAAKADLASPALTGTPTAPTAAAGTNTTQIATTAFVQSAGGLVLIASQSFSSVFSVSVNSCFTSTYSNYLVVFRCTARSNASETLFRVRASGADAFGNDYATVRTTSTENTGPGRSTSVNTSSFYLFYGGTGAHSVTTIQVGGPALAAKTSLLAISSTIDSAAIAQNVVAGGGHNLATSYDGLTFFPAAGTFTGTLRVYGYRD